MSFLSLLRTIPPLFFGMILYMAGSTAEHVHAHHLIAAPLTAGIAFCAFLAARSNSKRSKHIVVVCMLALGSYATGALRLRCQKKQLEAFHAHVHEKTIDITGTIADIDSTSHRLFSSTVTLENISTRPHGAPDDAWVCHSYKILIYTNIVNQMMVADTITLHAIPIKIPPATSYQTYLLKENIGITLFMSKLDIAKQHSPAHSLARLIFTQKHRLATTLKTKMSKKGHSIFSSLFLGKKENDSPIILQNNRELFAMWGISHYLARSGLHLVVLIALWLALFSLLPLSFNTKQLCLIAVGTAYLLLSWSSIPFYRALITFVLHRVCVLLRLQGSALYLLTATCMLILLFNPIQLFFLDFQLSFGLTFALACFTHIRTQQQTQQH